MARGIRRADMKNRLTPRRLSRMGWVTTQIIRVGKVLAAVMLVAWFCLWMWAGGALDRTEDWVQTKVANAGAEMGLRIEDVIVEGRYYLPAQTLKDAIGIEPGAPLIGVELPVLRERIAALSWVKDVSVRRALPDRLVVRLVERMPMALWLDAPGTPGVIDAEGVVLTRTGLGDFGPLLAVSGTDGDKQAAALIALLKGQPDIAVRIKKAIYISQRRWDLLVDGDTIVKLPQEDPGFALARLAKAQAQDKILEQGLKSIDLRHADRIILESKPGDMRDLLLKGGDPV